ncbi:MAG: 30S ribosomal protein S8 [Parcubacteria group bacterium]|jgi:small subunit ribosomal protein S8|nr:30S ribosomal protein S8 [Parcubacteria group bacterium]|tara:strand:- start:237 stop:626 length:390 start_codon:yes stop_codon:yes gene_type:complete
MVDPITDMLNRIRNAKALLKPQVSFPFSKLKYEISRILEKEGFIESVEEKGKKAKKTIKITLKYDDKESAITGLKRVSRPGQRIYSSSNKIKRVRRGYGITIISTSKGLMTDKKAKREKLGGEVLCQIW